MKFLKSLKRPTTAVAAIALMSLTSCNRGFGCPTFSISDVADSLFTTLVALF